MHKLSLSNLVAAEPIVLIDSRVGEFKGNCLTWTYEFGLLLYWLQHRNRFLLLTIVKIVALQVRHIFSAPLNTVAANEHSLFPCVASII